ncbi:MAG: sigma-54 dependent transcriptional regulator [Thermodesulfobacteriota bacterium]|nr:sigma-54 dependent transcriptional regulator [Thermodesulfobacteriota bacterium]
MNTEELSIEDFEILFVDDEKQILSLVKEYLSLNGYRVTVVDDGLKALTLVKEKDFDMVITDLKMPRFSGIKLLAAVKEHRPETEVIIVTGYGSIESAIESLKLGGYDYLQKPIRLERLKILVDRIVEKKRLQHENIMIKRRLKERYKYDELIGISVKMQQLYEIIDRISPDSPTVLIQGESGTGKEVVARVIHQNSDRKDMPFVPVNCGAIVEGLLESELFGHVKGAFTGATRVNIGLFKAAEKGTIFLDEVSEVVSQLQVKLLRVLQEKRLRPVGGTKEIDVDVRVIAAINRDPEEDIKSGALRKDLFYRLNVVPIKIPPLRERKEDIPLLINHFLSKHWNRNRRKVVGISPATMDILLNYDWPGNVRQLENVIQRVFALGVNETIEVADLPSEIREFGEASKIKGTICTLKENEIALIKIALHKTGGNKAEAAKLLGINVATLYRKIKRYEISDKALQNANL